MDREATTAQASAPPVLTLDHVTKTFGPVTVIDDVSVSVYPGKVQVLLGENGAGKSTLIKMMAGVYQPDGGRIIIDGKGTKLPNTNASEVYGIATIPQAPEALGARAGDDVFVVGFDGTADGLAAVSAGTMVATIAQQPEELGRLAVQQAKNALDGEEVTAEVPVEVVAVTQDNVAEFQS